MNKLANNLLIELATGADCMMEQVSKETSRIIKKHGPLSSQLRGLPELHDFLRAHQHRVLRLMAEHKAKATYQK